MKKFLIMLCVAALLAVGVSAAETVIYQNDFSDPFTLYDFQQYRAEWEIRDGALYLTDVNTVEVSNPNDNYSHIIYQLPSPLTEYIVEVDMFNAQTSAGLLFNIQQDKVGNGNSAIYGYTFNMSRDATIMALGSSNTKGGWQGNIHTGNATTGIHSGVNLHLSVIVKGGKIGLNATNMDTNKAVYTKTYSIGTNGNDPVWDSGTVGFRAIHKIDGLVNENALHFDNLVITTANETEIATVVNKNVAAPVVATRIDTSNITPVYTNNFDSADDIADFDQYFGAWDVIDGKLYVTDVADTTQSIIVYNGDDDIKYLSDYVLDVDMYNVQSQGGPIVRADIDRIDGTKGCEAFYGYIAFVSLTGEKAALGFGTTAGGWGGNIKVSDNIFTPGTNLHLQVAMKGEVITYNVSDLDTGKALWSTTQVHDMWSKGTFGFRLYTALREDGLDNVKNTAFDNLVISTYNDADASKTEIKMTVDSMTAFVNNKSVTLDAAPVIKNSRTMLPVRFVAENLGATVGWDDATKTVSIKSADVTIEIVIGAATAKVNGATINLDSPAYIDVTNNRTYLPVRVVAENLGATVTWDDATKTATLTK